MKNQNPARQALAEGAIHTCRDKLFPKPKERYARILVLIASFYFSSCLSLNMILTVAFQNLLAPPSILERKHKLSTHECVNLMFGIRLGHSYREPYVLSFSNDMRSRIKHRDRIDIFCQILEAANGSNAKKLKMMYIAKINYDQLREYLTVLTQNELLSYDLDRHTFKTTEKGLRFLDTYNKIDDVMKVSQ